MSATTKSKYVSSEQYRQMLVKDGDRRFSEWHNKFLAYQKAFLAAK
jgi:vacuolar-type H+-ATPase subunit B/Vma2